MFMVYRLSDGLFLRGMASQRPEYDPATEACEEYRAWPDRRTQRHDATAREHIRLATAQELAAYDDARAEAEATTRVADRQLVVLAEYLRQQLNVIRQGLPTPLPNITRVQALDDLKTIFKAR